ncbi:MAG: protein kinase [Butyrivibrio sp.]
MRCNNCFEEYDEDLQVCPHCGYTEGMQPKEAYMLFAGTVLQDRYIVGEVLGFGGFGITYKAYDTKLERVIAIKEYYPSGLVYRTPGTKEVVVFKGKRYKDYANGLTRFLDEARNATKFIDNPNIIDIMGFFEENGTAYFVMELLVGLPLDKYLAQNGGKVDVNSAIAIISAVGMALQSIHKEGYIHRDIAPDNIYICDNGKIKLFDFGAARFSAEEDKNLTVVLKPGYAPVEQYETVNKQGPWTDVYALGATMYRMVTGIKPDESTNRKTSDIVEQPKDIDSDISENLSNAIMRAMAVEKHLRYQNVQEFINAIKSEKKVVSVEKVQKRRKRFRWIGIASSIALIALGGFIFSRNWNEQKDEATLPDAEIDFWYIAEPGTEKGIEQVVADFIEMYPNVSINPYVYSEEEYAGELKNAIEENRAPAIFECTGLDEEYLENALDLNNAYSGIDIDNCYFLDKYKEDYSVQNRMPSSFEMPVIFINTYYANTGLESLDSLSDISVEENDILKYSVAEKWRNFYSENVDTDGWTEADGSVEAFISGEAYVYLGSNSDLEYVYSLMTGKCNHYTLPGNEVFCIPGNEWVINDLGEDENMVSERFLAYLIQDPTTQDYMYMQGDYGDKTKLPVNKAAISTLISDDVQFYGKILKEIEDFRMMDEESRYR